MIPNGMLATAALPAPRGLATLRGPRCRVLISGLFVSAPGRLLFPRRFRASGQRARDVRSNDTPS